MASALVGAIDEFEIKILGARIFAKWRVKDEKIKDCYNRRWE